MARKKMVNGVLLEVPSVSGRGKSNLGSAIASSKVHTIQDEKKEDEIFQTLKHKRIEEQEFTREHFINDVDTADEYPMISELINTWEELCQAIIQQHDFLDRRLVAERFKFQMKDYEEETKRESGKSTLSKAGLKELEK